MILIGSTARNSGKTTLAVSLIEKYKKQMPVIGIKVTTIDENNRSCIHGGEGCGACSSLKGDFEISEEKGQNPNKDTAMLLAAGAEKVYWLKTINTHIDEGIEALIAQIPKDTLIICESNTLRKFVNPAVFVMVRNTADSKIKKTAAEVIDQADIVFDNYFDGNFEALINEIEKRLSSFVTVSMPTK
ncbi:hypothetical protein GH810_07465 [Acetobacterium paludosum]|uniref:Molybdopterin-guanine dinucleotide biosynthesis protein B (MobB) domain-containing protein n=1 Tax=Acetobacterium paludosum TaxID=52693 RepID=A0A923HWY0_9FIRM|nr:molybdopterin-guanine dinucleotide biosynthesis protein B [Acetobacterium paludosum]MBC3888144.1 hypothetical protein [Acetobacterium paludosum]